MTFGQALAFEEGEVTSQRKVLVSFLLASYGSLFCEKRAIRLNQKILH